MKYEISLGRMQTSKRSTRGTGNSKNNGGSKFFFTDDSRSVRLKTNPSSFMSHKTSNESVLNYYSASIIHR